MLLGALLVVTLVSAWQRLSPAERWVMQHGWSAANDLRAITRGEIRDLSWPLVDATIVSGRGYAVVSVHDAAETELLFAPDKTGVEAFAREATGQSVRTIYGSWHEVVINE